MLKNFLSVTDNQLQLALVLTLPLLAILLPYGQEALGMAPTQLPIRSAGDHFFSRQDWNSAAAAYERDVATNPENGRAWFRLGYAYHAMEALDKAIIAHKRAAKFPRFAPTANYNLACALALTGKKKAALNALEVALTSGRINPQMVRNDPDLISLHDDARFERLLHNHPNALLAEYEQLDFWVGDWDVFSKRGEQVGQNKIEKLEGGFLIQENWTSSRGRTGKSTNYYDPATNKWRQIWISADGELSQFSGSFSEGAMRFEGTSVNPRGKREQARITLTPKPDGKVHHLSKHSGDEGKTWYVYFDGTYVPKE